MNKEEAIRAINTIRSNYEINFDGLGFPDDEEGTVNQNITLIEKLIEKHFYTPTFDEVVKAWEVVYPLCDVVEFEGMVLIGFEGNSLQRVHMEDGEIHILNARGKVYTWEWEAFNLTIRYLGGY